MKSKYSRRPNLPDYDHFDMDKMKWMIKLTRVKNKYHQGLGYWYIQDYEARLN